MPKKTSKTSKIAVRLRAALVLALAGTLAALPATAKKSKTELRAQVLDPAGETVAGALVVLAPAAGGESFQGKTDKKGELELDLPESGGTYLLRVTAEGLAPFESELVLSAGEVQQLQVRLLDAASGRRNEAVLAYNAGAQAFGTGDRALAREHFERAAELDPSLAQPHLGLADIYFSEGELEAAAAAIETFLTAQPDDPQGHRLAYGIYRELGDAEKLARELEAVRGTDFAKTLAIEVYNQGAVASQQGEYERAADRFASAAELDPQLSEAWASLALIQYNLEQYREALTSIGTLLELDPENVQGRRIRYLIYDALNLQDEASEALEAYREVDPQAAVELLYQRAELDFRTGHVESARAALQKVLATVPDMARAHYTLGLVYASEGEDAQARKHLERFIELAPDDPEVATAKDMLKYL